ncbi:Clavaminate synthase-like protein [Dichomitus squalens]|uniref:Clavaminate synthase-like protein n=1 Tax=Dichomitus squalens TaxID=114155 RepID=A0A4Q9N131_9APHY|nr:Clavaminate synthase-like protein [Dichomitus squalens]
MKFPRCTACIRKASGETCRFQNLRYLLRDKNRKVIGTTFGEGQAHAAPTLVSPSEWNTTLGLGHIDRVKLTVAKALLPVMKQEKQHMQLPNVIRRPRETGVRATCDACMTSIFSSSWMCRICGREACIDCYAYITEVADKRTPEPDLADVTASRQRERSSQRSPYFLPCTRRNQHQPTDFSPVSRFYEMELTQAIEDMEALLQTSHVETGRLSQCTEPETEATLAPGPSASIERPISGVSPSVIPEPTEAPALPVPSSSNGPEPPTTTTVLSERTIPSHDTSTLPCTELTEEAFQRLWSRGDPIIVTGLLPKFRIQWTPEYFSSHYGAERCTIVECQSERCKEVSVSQFFSRFGNYEHRRGYWKLKDWPPSADFKSTFPELYDDFAQATPVPDYVRRDGVLNIASHFPSNTIRPDLGPKMYNAMGSFESQGSKGSTRLHMDMADAINIMTYASQAPDGRPGCAAWDIYKAADTPKLRAFLYKKFGGELHNDPIHAQRFYLDSSLRQELYRDFGVVSHRIYQKPGEAVFIPAGCAHQVCNLADCIKVACDFVSPENVERCEVLTREFREQNHVKAWKEDVLQLRTMMWFAWVSCVREEKRIRERNEQNDDQVAGSASARLG